MTSIEVPDWVVEVALKAWFSGEDYEGADMSAFAEDMRECITAALGAWVVKQAYIETVEKGERIGHGLVWSDHPANTPGSTFTPLYTLRQEKPE